MPNASMKDLTVDRFLEAVASGEPVPGGGAVAALAGALAASLVHMVLSLSLRRAKDPATVPTLASLLDRAHALRLRFQDLADEDVAAYRDVAQTLALPRSTDAERAHRSALLQQSLATAAKVPLDTARLAARTLDLVAEVAPFCPGVARSDLLTAVHLARAACAAALANVDANALSLDESPSRRELARACSDLATAARTRAEELLTPLEAALERWREPRDPPPSA